MEIFSKTGHILELISTIWPYRLKEKYDLNNKNYKLYLDTLLAIKYFRTNLGILDIRSIFAEKICLSIT
ncbi:hypothetical protein [Clostridium pasteurianum]|uniref:hypothetical protein n=1 Tax=Clostridium pasteurianum TaxID=1501 RepID=UPI0002A73E9E|nr:hypothetical protein [Clostridium pasteurianum]ELP59112.1 hypothetical protein F502_11521 [Clostridium pasteurianum DSM 525 = ATCC 6013]